MNTKEQLQQEYKELRAFTDNMTVGQRFTNEGQTKLEREFEVCQALAALENIPAFEYCYKFEKGQV